MKEQLITYRGVVYPWHCDHMGHMNVMWYVGKFDEATWQLVHRLGITPSYLQDNQRGLAAVDQHLQYQRELKAGDLVTVRSQVLELHERKIRFRHEMINDGTGEVAAIATLVGVHMDSLARKAAAFPPELMEKVRLFMAVD